MLKKVLSCCIAATFGIYSASSLAQGSALNSTENLQQPIAPLMLASSDDAITDRYIVVLKQPQMLMNGYYLLLLLPRFRPGCPIYAPADA